MLLMVPENQCRTGDRKGEEDKLRPQICTTGRGVWTEMRWLSTESRSATCGP